MEGINILNQTEIFEYPGWWIWAVIGSAIILGISIAIFTSYTFTAAGTVAVFTSLISFIACTVLLFAPWMNVPTGRYKYEVIIDETVSVTELYEKYEIVGQEGKIWFLEDKE